MRASRLRESVLLQRWTGSAWEDVTTLFAEIIPTDGDGVFQFYQVTVRWGSAVENILPVKDLAATHQFIWKSKTLDIFPPAVNVGQRDREAVLRCRETLPQAT